MLSTKAVNSFLHLCDNFLGESMASWMKRSRNQERLPVHCGLQGAGHYLLQQLQADLAMASTREFLDDSLSEEHGGGAFED